MSEITEKQYHQLKSDVEDAKAAAERARGALQQTIDTLKEEFDVDNLKEAKAKLITLETKASKSQKDFERAFKVYETKWTNPED